MGNITINVDAERVDLTPSGKYISVDMDMDARDLGNVLDAVSIQDIVDHIKGENLLDYIDNDVIKTHLENG